MKWTAEVKLFFSFLIGRIQQIFFKIYCLRFGRAFSNKKREKKCNWIGFFSKPLIRTKTYLVKYRNWRKTWTASYGTPEIVIFLSVLRCFSGLSIMLSSTADADACKFPHKYHYKMPKPNNSALNFDSEMKARN